MASPLSKGKELLEASGKGTVIAQIPFKPTVWGTDTYTDQLWED